MDFLRRSSSSTLWERSQCRQSWKLDINQIKYNGEKSNQIVLFLIIITKENILPNEGIVLVSSLFVSLALLLD
jgi:hypothetical protein